MPVPKFRVVSSFSPAGDQGQAIEARLADVRVGTQRISARLPQRGVLVVDAETEADLDAARNFSADGERANRRQPCASSCLLS